MRLKKKLPIDIVRNLLALKANPNARDNEGRSALMHVITKELGKRRDTDEIVTLVKLLLNAKANVHFADNDRNETVLFRAFEDIYDNNDLALARLLIKAKADVNWKNTDGYTILELTCHEFVDEIRLLKKSGAKGEERRCEQSKPASDSESSNAAACARWAESMPALATPRNSGDLERACSNMWSRGSDDFDKCVAKWRSCARRY